MKGEKNVCFLLIQRSGESKVDFVVMGNNNKANKEQQKQVPRQEKMNINKSRNELDNLIINELG